MLYTLLTYKISNHIKWILNWIRYWCCLLGACSCHFESALRNQVQVGQRPCWIQQEDGLTIISRPLQQQHSACWRFTLEGEGHSLSQSPPSEFYTWSPYRGALSDFWEGNDSWSIVCSYPENITCSKDSENDRVIFSLPPCSIRKSNRLCVSLDGGCLARQWTTSWT